MARRKTRRSLPAKMETQQERFQVIQWCQAELREMKRLGNFDGDPEQWHPVRKLVNILEDPLSTKPEQIKCAEIILQYIEAPKAALLKLENGGDGPPNIVIQVANWAALPG